MLSKALPYKGIEFNYLKISSKVFSCTTKAFFSSKLAVEEDLFDTLKPKNRRVGNEDLSSPQLAQTSKSSITSKVPKAQPVLLCKRPEYNHYKNQRYDKLSPIPLASKGWHHRQSKGDYFTINICNEEEYVESLFWDAPGASSKTFQELELSDNLIAALGKAQILQPTKIQVNSIPLLMSGKNALITAETGCGKTLAYLIPAIQQILNWKKLIPPQKPNTPLVLVLTPGRELAEQIGAVANEIAQNLPFSCRVLTGGRTKQRMLNPQFQYVDLLVASIGAMSKLTTMGIYDVSEVRHLILDEADTLLDDSFNELLLRYLNKFKIRYGPDKREKLPSYTQLSLVSATMPTSLYSILENFVEPDSLNKVSTGRAHQVLPHVPQKFYRLGPSQKPLKLITIVSEAVKKQQPMIIFSNKSKTCDWISLVLNENGINSARLNGDMPVVFRKGAFKEFLEGRVNVLSCTDVASRGLDTIRAKHILNYDFPVYMADYIHRCGRAGRVGSPLDCMVSNFVCGSREVDLVNKIEMAVRTMDKLSNVNANITKIIYHRMEKGLGKKR